MVGWNDGLAAGRNMSDSRVMRVFISSTFRDMQGERDELVKRVFPAIRKICEARGVVWGEIDLRWGVTDEQAAEDEVLPICLAEIERTRPYFVGLLGDRYGWVPDGLPGDLADREAWLRDDQGRSVTELEILHGVLNNPDMAAYAFFYLRDPAWARALPQAEQATYLEATPQGRDRLLALKARVQQSPFPCRSYAHPQAVGDAVYADLMALLDRLFPEATVPDQLARARGNQQVFTRILLSNSLVRTPWLTRLEVAVEAETGAAVTGAPGAGVSTLLAELAERYRQTHPQECLLVHHLAADPPGAGEVALLQHWLGELGVAQGDLPNAVDGLRRLFALRLTRAALAGPVLLVVDGLHLLDDDACLAWLPLHLPTGVRILAGTRPGTALGRLQQRGVPRIDLPALSDDERVAVAVAFLRHFAKTLDKPLLGLLATSTACGNARHLRTVLDELRQHGDHFTLAARLGGLLQPPEFLGVVDLVLQRLLADFETEQPGLTARVLGWLAVAQTGLTEAEVLTLLGTDGLPAARRPVSSLRLAADNLLIDVGGRLRLVDSEVAQAVLARFAPAEVDRQRLHAQVARGFATAPCSPRALDELAWQWLGAGDYDALAALLTNRAFVVAAHERDATVLARWWTHLATVSPHRVTALLPLCEEAPASHAASIVLPLLAAAGHATEVAHLRGRAVTLLKSDDPKGNLKPSLLNLAAALYQAAEPVQALATVDELFLCIAPDDPPAWHIGAWQNRAVALRALGRLPEARAALEQAERLAQAHDAPADVQAAAGELAGVLFELGDLGGALRANEAQMGAAQASGDTRARMYAAITRANLLAHAGQANVVGPWVAEGEALARNLGDLNWLASALEAKAANLGAGGRAVEAATTLRELADLRDQLGQHDHARHWRDQAAAIVAASAPPSPQERQRAAEHKALRHMAAGNHRGALELLDEQAQLLAEHPDARGLAACLGNQAVCWHFLGEHARVPPLLDQQLQLARQIGDPQGLAVALANRGEAMARQGDHRGAALLLAEAHGLAVALGQPAFIAAVAQLLETVRRPGG